MKKVKYILQSLAIISVMFMLFLPHAVSAANEPAPTPAAGTVCTPSDSTFLGLVPWYHYLKNDFTETINPDGTSSCGFHADLTVNFICTTKNTTVKIGNTKETCTTQQQTDHAVISGVSESGLDAVWLVGLAIFEDLLRVAGLATVAFVIYGGFRYTTSSGSPEQTGAALGTIIHALVGLTIVIIAATSIAYIAKLFY